jgi:HD-like signal output (HDOD) protein
VLQAIDELQGSTQLEFTPEQVDAALMRLHCEVGARLVRTWKLPEWTSAAARFHHAPEAASECVDEVYTVHLAFRLARHADGLEELGDVDPALAALGLYQEDLDALIEQSESIRGLAAVLS